MRFIQQKSVIWAISGLMLLPLLFLFQNCGNKSFTAKTEATLSSVEDTTDIQEPEVPVDPEAPIKSKIVTIARDIKEERPTSLLLILDDSISNAANIPNMLAGVKDILAKFAGKNFKVSVYTTGNSPLDKVDYSIGKYVTVTKNETPDVNSILKITTTSFVGGLPLAEFNSELTSNSDAFFSKVEDYFKKVQASTKIMADSTPDYHCQLLSYFKELSKQSDLESSKYIVLVSSDENTKFQTAVCLEKDMVEQLKTFKGNYKTTAAKAARNYIEIPMERKDIMEGGVEVWTKITQKFYDLTCKDGVQARVDSHIVKNPTYRLTSKGIVCTDKIQAATAEKQEKIYELVSEKKDSTPMFSGLNYSQQVSEMQKSFNKGLLFYGTFTIRSASEQKNPDQEIGADHDKYAGLYAAETNFGKYGVTQSNYDDFVDEVFVFDVITTNNFFSLADHDLANTIIRSVKLKKYNGLAVNKILPFTQTTSSLTVTDPSINLNEGCDLEIEYQDK